MKRYLFIISILLICTSSYAQSYRELIDHKFDNKHLVKENPSNRDSVTFVLDHMYNKHSISKHKFELGAKWTYEKTCIIPNSVSFQVYEIVDTLSVNENPCYIFNTGDTVCTEGNKVFAIDHRLTNGMQLLNDYDAETEIPFECFEPSIGITNYNITIDSSVTETIADGQLIKAIYVDTFCAYGWIGNLKTKIYEGIGSSIIRPFPCLDFCNDIATPVTCETGKLRCFENSTESFKFVDYACDSIWMTSSTKEIPDEAYVIYPNPTNESIYIKNGAQNIWFSLMTIQGQTIEEGYYNFNGIALPYQGVFVLTTIDNKKNKWTHKVIRH